jgi:hypothetical protein
MINPRAAAHIASLWHAGGGSALYQFASTGTITHRVFSEVAGDLDNELVHYIDTSEWEHLDHVKELTRLLEFLVTTGERGPQDGWYELAVGQGRG